VISRPTDDEFIEWMKYDENASKVREALSLYPDLVTAKYVVRIEADNEHFYFYNKNQRFHLKI